MGRPAKGVRHWYDKQQKRYFIRDGELKISLGFGREAENHLERADLEVARYIAERQAVAQQKLKNQEAAAVIVADVISLYMEQRFENWQLNFDAPPSRPNEALARLAVVLDFFGEMTVDQIDDDAVQDFIRYLDDLAYKRGVEKAAAAYAKLKKRRNYKPENDPGARTVVREHKPKAAIRYLDDLKAAVNYAHRKSLLRHTVHIPTPKDYEMRKAIFTRQQIAALIHAARRKRGLAFIDGKPVPDARIWEHLARFILIALYSGSRKSKIFRIAFSDQKDRPWVKFRQVRTRSGQLKYRATFYRLGDEEIVFRNKQAPELEVPARLVAHLERWKRMGLKYPCQDVTGHSGDPSGAMRKLFEEVLGDEEDVVIHTLRHTAATWLVSRAELPLASIAGYLGMSIETLVRRYAKIRKSDQLLIGRAITESRVGVEFEDDEEIISANGNGRFLRRSA